VGDELPTIVKELTQEKIDRYAEASGDHNPLHLDPQFAAQTQFGGTIAHGMLMLAYVSEMLTAAFGQAWVSAGRLRARFKAPARPGDTVRVTGRVVRREEAVTGVEVRCSNQNGEVLASCDAEVQL
jgi:3-hydroxybutyryl-CoA dehydratase